MQILPSTAVAMGMPRDKAMDPATNVTFAARLIRENIALIRSWQPSITDVRLKTLVIAAYNAGPANAFRGRFTQQYVNSVWGHWRNLGGGPLSYHGEVFTARPTADLRLKDVLNLSSDTLPAKGDVLELTFELAVDVELHGQPVMTVETETARVSLVERSSGSRSSQAKDVGSFSPSVVVGHRTTFKIRIEVHDTSDARVLVRLDFSKAKSGSTTHWPWSGVLGSASLPMRVFYLSL